MALSPLSPAQTEIMEIFWRRGTMTVREVWSECNQTREVSRNTVLTMLIRMEEKGWLQRRKVGRHHVYKPTTNWKQAVGRTARRVVDDLFDGSPTKLMAALIDGRGLSSHEVERIRAMLDEAERSRTQTPGDSK